MIAPRLLYSAFMLLALVVFVLARRFVFKSDPLVALTLGDRLVLALAAFSGGALGAKLPFVLDSDASWWSRAAWLSDGKTILTGLVGAYLAVELAKLVLDIRVKTG